jgi:hypothetical protein
MNTVNMARLSRCAIFLTVPLNGEALAGATGLEPAPSCVETRGAQSHDFGTAPPLNLVNLLAEPGHADLSDVGIFRVKFRPWGLRSSMRRMIAERSTPNSARRFSTGLFAAPLLRSGSSRRSAVRIRQEIHPRARQPVGNFRQHQELLCHDLGKEIHYRTRPYAPSSLALLVTQTVKRVFEPLPSCL